MKSAIACRDFDRLMSAYIDHEASADEIRAIEEHARDCSRCALSMQRLRRLTARLDLDLQSMLNEGDRHTRRVYLPPATLLDDRAAAPRLLSAVSTVAMVLVFFALAAFVLVRAAPADHPVQTAAQVGATQPDVAQAVSQRLVDPTSAYVFFIIGLYALFVEIAHPGARIPAITGGLCMLVAAIAFTRLPVNWAGVCGLIAGVGLIALELKASRHGLLMLFGVVCVAFGSLTLYHDVVIAPGVLLGMVLLGIVLGILLVRLARRVHDLPPLNQFEQLIGAHGVARTGLEPDGVVHVQGQLWSARARGGPLAPGSPVRVIGRRGLVLDVESASFRAAATQKGANW
jgi:membrane protein implicated in regulation of membrane protease activity